MYAKGDKVGENARVCKGLLSRWPPLDFTLETTVAPFQTHAGLVIRYFRNLPVPCCSMNKPVVTS